MASNSADGSFIVTTLKEGLVAAFTQELLVLAVFFTSFIAWRNFGRRGKRRPGAGVAKTMSFDEDWSVGQTTMSFTATGSGCDFAQGAKLRQVHNAAIGGASLQQARAIEQQMLKHLEQREFTRALNLYRTVERDGRDKNFTEELYSAFIQSSIRVGKVDVVERMLRAMKRNGVTPTLRFWQTTLKMLSSRKHYSVCLSIHSLFGRLIPTDKVIFSCLINAALEIGRPERAEDMLERYGECDIDPKDYVLFFRTYVTLNKVDAAEVIFRKLGDKTSTLMLNLLLLTCVNVKQPQRGLDFLNEAHVIEKDMEAKVVDVVSYNTVIKGFAQAGQPAQCFECLNEMHSRGVEPDDITFGTLLDACIVDNDINAAHAIVNLLMSNDRPMDTVMCTLFIKGLVRANCLPKALVLYEEMRRREGAHPDIVTFSVLIKALVDQHDLERALKLVEDMSTGGQSPDDIILTHLLEGCRHAGNHELGKKLFGDMLIAGVKPSEFTLVTMLKLHGRCGAHKEAYDLVANWESQHQFKPSVIHYTCLMSGCLRTKSYEQAWSAYQLMITNGVQADEMAISTLLPGMVAGQQWDQVLVLARQALKVPNPLSIPAETMNNALSQMMQVNGFGRQAEQLQILMVAAGIPITTKAAKRMACASRPSAQTACQTPAQCKGPT